MKNVNSLFIQRKFDYKEFGAISLKLLNLIFSATTILIRAKFNFSYLRQIKVNKSVLSLAIIFYLFSFHYHLSILVSK